MRIDINWLIDWYLFCLTDIMSCQSTPLILASVYGLESHRRIYYIYVYKYWFLVFNRKKPSRFHWISVVFSYIPRVIWKYLPFETLYFNWQINTVQYYSLNPSTNSMNRILQKCMWFINYNGKPSLLLHVWQSMVYGSRGNTLSLMSALYLWATLRCGVIGCLGNLVWDVRGFPRAPSTESVVYDSVGA